MRATDIRRPQVVVVESAPIDIAAWRAVLAGGTGWSLGFVPDCRDLDAVPRQRGGGPASVVVLNLGCAGSAMAFHTRDCIRLLGVGGHSVLVRAAAPQSHLGQMALAVGARGLVRRDAPVEAVREAVATLLQGGVWLDPQSPVDPAEARLRVPVLAVSEETALSLYAAGLTLDAVARKMRVQAGTVRTYLERTKRKYRLSERPIRSRADFTLRAIEDGYLPLS